MSVKHVPDGYQTVTPYLIVPDAKELIRFVEQAFGATVNICTSRPDGSIGHAEVQIGTSRIMLGQSSTEWPPVPAALYLYVEDCDAWYQRALAVGARSLSEPATMFYGDRHGGVVDSNGNTWWLATHVEDVSPEEIERRDAERQ